MKHFGSLHAPMNFDFIHFQFSILSLKLPLKKGVRTCRKNFLKLLIKLIEKRLGAKTMKYDEDYNNPEINKSIARHSPTCSGFHADSKNITFKAVRLSISE